MIATVTLNPSLDEWIEVDRLQVGALHRARRFLRYPGGKGINVSRVVHELGGRTVAFGVMGGADGAILQDLLRRLAIPHELVPISGLTRNNYKIRTRTPRAVTEVNTEGPRVMRTSLARVFRCVLHRSGRVRAVALSGSLPPGAPAGIYRAWIREFGRRGIPTVLDSSGQALRQGLLARPWLIKPNRAEAEELLGRRLPNRRSIIQGAQALLQRGPEVVILSIGAEGALLAAPAPIGIWVAKPPKIKTSSAVGAGDSLVGGFLHGWSRTGDLVEAFRLGVACGTATAMTPGTELCHRRDVVRVLPRVVARRLS
ncbi:MAG: 1-phosphofructokinase [Candidatus Omnitrophica bacterium CG11_big_fil_rev_8_21_14_0_20_63_9]|nr:MAG: 1-phosphofructokinase [Candidatus Omnitrophica bacterium CG11_big_fil_rev_8_21_14_0_20_63_9]